MTRYPAVKLNGEVYVGIHDPNSKRVKDRIPVRHTDVLTVAINTVASSNIQSWDAAKIIKAIDMGHYEVIFGTANADGSDFVEDART